MGKSTTYCSPIYISSLEWTATIYIQISGEEAHMVSARRLCRTNYIQRLAKARAERPAPSRYCFNISETPLRQYTDTTRPAFG